MPLMLDFDSTASLPANYIQDEIHTITGPSSRYWVLSGGCFFTKDLVLRRVSDNAVLRPGIDYKALHYVASAGEETGKEVCSIIWVNDPATTGDVKNTYRAVGGQYSATTDALETVLTTLATMSFEEVAWSQVVGAPSQYPPTPHGHNIADWYGLGGLITKLEELRQAALQGDIATIQMIYQYIDNAIDALAASAGALTSEMVESLIASAITAHKSTNGEHSKTSIGLPNVPNWSALLDADATAANAAGKATHFISAAQVLSLIQDRVTRAWLGVDNLPNYPVASDAETNSGTAANRLQTVAGVSSQVASMSKIGTTSASAASALGQQFLASFNDANPPTDAATGGVLGIVQQVYKVQKGTAVTASTPRVQLALIMGGTNARGLWTREHNGTSFSAWAPAAGINSLDFNPTASDTEAWAGSSTTKIPSVAQSTIIARKQLRHNGSQTNVDLDVTLEPVLVCTSNKGPTGVTTQTWKVTTVLEATTATAANATNMPRVQTAEGITLRGTWVRRFNGTSWSKWKRNGGTMANNLYANINHALVSRFMCGAGGGGTDMRLGPWDSNMGIAVFFSRHYSGDTTDENMVMVTPGGYVNGPHAEGWLKSNAYTLSSWAVRPGSMAGTQYLRSVAIASAGAIESAANHWVSRASVFKVWGDIVASNYVAGNTTNYRSAITSVDNNTDEISTPSVNTHLRLAGRYSFAAISARRSMRTNPGGFELNVDDTIDGLNRKAMCSMVIVATDMVGSSVPRFMLSTLDSDTGAATRFGMSALRYGSSNIDLTGFTPAVAAAGANLNDSSFMSTTTAVSLPVPGAKQYFVGCDSTGGLGNATNSGVHAIVTTTAPAAGVAGEGGICFLCPVYDSTNNLFMTYYITTNIILNNGEKLMGMCSWDGFGSYAGTRRHFHHTAVITNLGRIIVHAVPSDIYTDTPSSYLVADFQIDDIEVDGSSVSIGGSPGAYGLGAMSIGYAGGIFWIRGKTSSVSTTNPYEVAVPWTPSMGTPMTGVMTMRELPDADDVNIYANPPPSWVNCRSVLPMADRTVFFNEMGVRMGRINYTDVSFLD